MALTFRRFFLISRLNLLLDNLNPMFLCLSLIIEKVYPVFYMIDVPYFKDSFHVSLPPALFFKLNIHVPSYSSQVFFSQALYHFGCSPLNMLQLVYDTHKIYCPELDEIDLSQIGFPFLQFQHYLVLMFGFQSTNTSTSILLVQLLLVLVPSSSWYVLFALFFSKRRILLFLSF